VPAEVLSQERIPRPQVNDARTAWRMRAVSVSRGAGHSRVSDVKYFFPSH